MKKKIEQTKLFNVRLLELVMLRSGELIVRDVAVAVSVLMAEDLFHHPVLLLQHLFGLLGVFASGGLHFDDLKQIGVVSLRRGLIW